MHFNLYMASKVGGCLYSMMLVCFKDNSRMSIIFMLSINLELSSLFVNSFVTLLTRLLKMKTKQKTQQKR